MAGKRGPPLLSDSTERWDFAPIAADKALLNPFGNNYKKTRLSYHLDRVGIYYALVHGSRSPDLLIEEDVLDGHLKNYRVAYWIGDCVNPKLLKPLEEWVAQGGHFFIESMPVFAATDQVEIGPDAKAVASFKSGAPAVVERNLGKGKITYIAALPGVTYLWSAYQPPLVPSRGPSSHMQLTNFNPDAGRWILGTVGTAKEVTSNVEAEGAWFDARLLKSPKGYAVPLANYSADTQKPVILTIRGVKGITKIISANQGELKIERLGDEAVKINYTAGIGDILRIEAP